MLRGEELEKLFHGQITEDEYWQQVSKNNKWKIDINILKKAIRDNFQEVEGIRTIIEKLKQRGYNLGLLSVHAKEWVDYCNHRYGYHKLFDSILYSFEVGLSKPNKKVYELILNKLKARPEECLFIDDKESNLVTARELGIRSIQFKNYKQLIYDLKREGISV
jgi:putative hydrolase of the HAD superfamily